MEQSLRLRLLRVGLVVVGAVLLAGAAVALWPRTDQVVGHAFPIPSGEDRVTIEVLNATARPGLARIATRLLRRHGLDVVYFGNADSSAGATRVVVRRGGGEEAGRVAQVLGIRLVTTEIDTFRRVDFSVILGQDFAPPAAARP